MERALLGTCPSIEFNFQGTPHPMEFESTMYAFNIL